ncbi:MAG: hypothetical protein RJA34_1373 [Pseudomonadota bacterium]
MNALKTPSTHEKSRALAALTTYDGHQVHRPAQGGGELRSTRLTDQ